MHCSVSYSAIGHTYIEYKPTKSPTPRTRRRNHETLTSCGRFARRPDFRQQRSGPSSVLLPAADGARRGKTCAAALRRLRRLRVRVWSSLVRRRLLSTAPLLWSAILRRLLGMGLWAGRLRRPRRVLSINKAEQERAGTTERRQLKSMPFVESPRASHKNGLLVGQALADPASHSEPRRPGFADALLLVLNRLV